MSVRIQVPVSIKENWVDALLVVVVLTSVGGLMYIWSHH